MTRFRLYEWLAAWLAIYVGVVVAWPGDVWTGASHAIVRATAPEVLYGAAFIVVGLVRAAALVINGRAPRGSPIARVLGATVSCALFASVSVLFLKAYPAGLISGGVLLSIAAADCVIVWRATRELRSARHGYHA